MAVIQRLPGMLASFYAGIHDPISIAGPRTVTLWSTSDTDLSRRTGIEVYVGGTHGPKAGLRIELNFSDRSFIDLIIRVDDTRFSLGACADMFIWDRLGPC